MKVDIKFSMSILGCEDLLVSLLQVRRISQAVALDSGDIIMPTWEFFLVVNYAQDNLNPSDLD